MFFTFKYSKRLLHLIVDAHIDTAIMTALMPTENNSEQGTYVFHHLIIRQFLNPTGLNSYVNTTKNCNVQRSIYSEVHS